MAFAYQRPIQQPLQNPPNRQYQKIMYSTPQYYYQAPPQQTMYSNAQQIIYPPTQQYTMMQYVPQNGQQAAAPIYVPEDIYTQQMQMSMVPMQQQPQQQIRYMQPQQQQQIIEQPSPSQTIDAKKKKKDFPTSPKPAIPQYQPLKKQVTMPPAQQYPVAQPVQQTSSPQIQPEVEQARSLENCLPKVPTNIISKEFSIPPGCFNIIKRGNLPGLSFFHV